ncbi:G protein-coupled receptor [Lachnellula occidentalis]|uniref:G protein-coupled receptor n=1 Tax=Lachnellula occidentalis TaxID=215460 RepID=A0A8H8U6R5_9HELO|nr:G protein-coupled receptor [Lachnellula occidentalis]
MAPLSAAVTETMYGAQIIARDLSGNSTDYKNPYTASQQTTLQILALTFSTVSVASAMLAFYWFVKMRRSFRHDLIMLLIQSDMFKALWFMIYPIVTFSRGPVPGSSRFCQVNGFFLSLGMEASDFAILQIALHTALYIFKPRISSGEGGLYPYRKFAYICWVIFPVLMASLAFINGREAYDSEETYCYLPVRPFWYRLALGWIPRYIIFIVILCIYASIYFYVRYKFHGFKRAGKNQDAGNGTSLDSEGTERPSRKLSTPATPSLARHGLIPDSSKHSTIKEGRKHSASTRNSFGEKKATAATSVHRFMWSNIMGSINPAGSPSPPREVPASDIDSFVGPMTPQPLPDLASATPMSLMSPEPSEMPSRSRVTSWRDTIVHRFSLFSDANTRERSIVDIHGILRHPNGSDSPPLSRLELVNSRGQNLADAEMVRTRDKIRRQLRFLFIYPLVYIGMWAVPFVSHVLQYDDRFATNPPFGLSCVTTIFVCSQAAVDCWLFSTREKPWRHIPENSGSFWGSFKFWKGWDGASKRKVVRGPGKTRGEMVREARVAYLRRDEELAQKQLESGLGPREDSTAPRMLKEWWEHSAETGMSPVAEDVSNPMEDSVRLDDSTSTNATLTNVKTSSSPDTHVMR